MGYFEDRIANGGDGKLVDALGESVTYSPLGGGDPSSVTVVWVDEGSLEEFDRRESDADLVRRASVEVRLSEVASAAPGDMFTRGGEDWVVMEPGEISGGWQTLGVRRVEVQTISGNAYRA